GPAIGIIFNSTSGFGPWGATPVASLSGILQAVDLNGDGIDELLEQPVSPAAGVSVRAVVPGGTLGAPVQSWPDLTLVNGPGVEMVRDLDGDGDRDVLA